MKFSKTSFRLWCQPNSTDHQTSLGAKKQNRNLFILLCVCIIAFLVNNHIIIPDIMESRNLVTAREMVYDQHWLIPTMNGELRLEKPPLPTWIAAWTEIFFPDNLSAVRFIPGLMGIFLLFYFYKLAFALCGKFECYGNGNRRRYAEQYALYASLILCTCYNIILMSRTVTWDIYCHAFMMGGIYHLYRLLNGYESEDLTNGNSNSPRAVWRNAITAGVLFGLSFMSKGPVSFFALLLPFLIAYFIFVKKDRTNKNCMPNEMPVKYKASPIIVMLLLAVIVGGAWYLYIWLNQSNAGLATLHKESGSWINRNVRPWYYYSTFFTETGCWALLTITSLAIPYWRKHVKQPTLYLFCFVWMIATIVLLSLLPEKKNRYLLPVLIPVSLTLAHLVCYWVASLKNNSSKTDRVIYRVNVGLLGIAALALLIGSVYLLAQGDIGIRPGLVLTMSIAISLWMLWIAFRQYRARLMLYGIVFLFAGIELFGMPIVGSLFCNTSYTPLKALQERSDTQGLNIYTDSAEEEIRIEMVYDAHHNISQIDITDSTAVAANTPFIFLTQASSDNALTESLGRQFDIVDLGTYDGNRHHQGTKFYRDLFIYRAILIRTKK